MIFNWLPTNARLFSWVPPSPPHHLLTNRNPPVNCPSTFASCALLQDALRILCCEHTGTHHIGTYVFIAYFTGTLLLNYIRNLYLSTMNKKTPPSHKDTPKCTHHPPSHPPRRRWRRARYNRHPQLPYHETHNITLHCDHII